MKPGVYGGISDTVYHSDRETLSSSGARTILSRSPATFRWEQDHPRPYVAAFEIGHAVHTLALGEGDEFEVIDTDRWTEKAKVLRDEALRAGRTPLKRSEWQMVCDMAEACLAHPVAGPLLTRPDTVSEQSLYWRDDETGVACRARTDLAVKDWSVVVDVKSTTDADPRHFAKSAADYGYHVQQAWYDEAIKAIQHVAPDFVFLVIEKTPPYLISVVQLDDDAVRLGHAMASRARQIFAECTASGEWPGYDPTPQTISLPRWAQTQLEEQYL